MFKVYLKDIKPNGIDILEEILAEDFGLSPEDYFYFRGQIETKAHVEKIKDAVTAQAHVRARYGSFCSRCLEPLEGEWDQDYNFSIPVEKGQECVELGDEIRQEILLNLPAALTCRNECLGVCPDCGVNLNTETCKCASGKVKEGKGQSQSQSYAKSIEVEGERTHRPFEGLKDID